MDDDKAVAPPEAAADALAALLRRLASRIRTETSAASTDLGKRARLAQVSTVEAVCSKCVKYLTGSSDDQLLHPPMSIGEVRDLLDTVLVEARESKLARSEAEEQLRRCEANAIPNPERDRRLADLLRSESRLCSEVQAAESQAAAASATALRTCITEMTDVLLGALNDARKPGLLPGEQRRIATEAKNKIESIASAWAAWFARSEYQASTTKHSSSSCGCNNNLDRFLAADPDARAISVALMRTLKLCRQQARTAAALDRISSAVSACDALSALAASIDDVEDESSSPKTTSGAVFEAFALRQPPS